MAISLPSLIVSAVLTGASMLMNMTRRIEGPRLEELDVSVGDYGAPVPRVWGQRRVQPPVFWSEPLKEEQVENKTKGGKITNYRYSGTWAVALTDRPIEGVLRIWADTHPVYDATGAGPVSPFDFGEEASAVTDYIAIYDGTQTAPDERMQASVEALQGAGACPAYLGLSYIVFKDVPLEKFGNRIPQISVEFVSAAAATYPFDLLDTSEGIATSFFSRDGARLITFEGHGAGTADDRFEIWDVAARARMLTGPLPGGYGFFNASYGSMPDGSMRFVSYDGNTLYSLSADCGAAASVASLAVDQLHAFTVVDGAGTGHWGTVPSGGVDTFYFDAVEYSGGDLAGRFFRPTHFFTDCFGDVWTCGVDSSAFADEAVFVRLVSLGTSPIAGAVHVATGLTGTSGSGREVYAAHWAGNGGQGHFVFAFGAGNWHIYDLASAAVTATAAQAASTQGEQRRIFANLRPGAGSLWADLTEVSLADLSTIRTVSLSSWSAGSMGVSLYDPVNHALWINKAGNPDIFVCYLDRIGAADVTLAQICGDVADWVGVEDHDFSAFDQVVPGWSVTQGQGSAMLEPLLDAFDCDIVPHEFGIKGIKRGGTLGATIATARMVAAEPRYTVRVRQSAELPRALTYSFADLAADQQPNAVRVERPEAATGARDERTIDLSTFASDATTMRGLAERHFRRLHGERKEAEFALTWAQLALVPGDRRTIETDGETWPGRCVRTTISPNGTVACEFRYDHASFATLGTSAGAEMEGRPESAVVIPLLSKGFVLDIPLLSDAHDSALPQLYLFAGPYAAGTWPGAGFFTGSEYTTPAGAVPGAAQATWGYSTDALADVSSPWIWDRANSVNVVLQVGSLSGCTEAEIDASPGLNLALIGDEIVQFTTATLEGDGSYTLTGFKRGRRGTEQHTGTHTERDVFLLLASPVREERGLADVGTNLSFKAVTTGRTASGAFPIALAPFTGASLKPLAPVHLTAVREADDDWALSWVRRTRIGGAWTSGTPIPLGEASEEYEVEILNGASVVRTITGLTSAATTYTAAQQVTDFGSVQTALDWRVYQISDAVGRGFVSETA